MTWFIKNDKTPGVITAKKHLESNLHKNFKTKPLPENAIVFCMGKWDQILMDQFGAEVYIEKLKRFLSFTSVLKIPSVDDWCFLHGGPGAPVCADTIETIHALGVKRAVLVGMVGGFGKDIQIGNVVVPQKILSCEGTSIHYVGKNKWAKPTFEDAGFVSFLRKEGFVVSEESTISTDAVYRQTFAKEAKWRSKGCVGVDLEGSAFLNVGKFLNMQTQVVFLVSDKHPLNEGIEKDWHWGADDDARKKFIAAVVGYFALGNDK